MSIAHSGGMCVRVCAHEHTHTGDRVLGKPKSCSSVRQTVVAACGYCIFFAGIPVNTPRPALPAGLSPRPCCHRRPASHCSQSPGEGPTRKLKGDQGWLTLWPITRLNFFLSVKAYRAAEPGGVLSWMPGGQSGPGARYFTARCQTHHKVTSARCLKCF